MTPARKELWDRIEEEKQNLIAAIHYCNRNPLGTWVQSEMDAGHRMHLKVLELAVTQKMLEGICSLEVCQDTIQKLRKIYE